MKRNDTPWVELGLSLPAWLFLVVVIGGAQGVSWLWDKARGRE